MLIRHLTNLALEKFYDFDARKFLVFCILNSLAHKICDILKIVLAPTLYRLSKASKIDISHFKFALITQ